MGRFLSMCEGRGSVGMVGIGYTIEPNPTTYTCKLNIEVCSVPDKIEHLRMCVRVSQQLFQRALCCLQNIAISRRSEVVR